MNILKQAIEMLIKHFKDKEYKTLGIIAAVALIAIIVIIAILNWLANEGQTIVAIFFIIALFVVPYIGGKKKQNPDVETKPANDCNVLYSEMLRILQSVLPDLAVVVGLRRPLSFIPIPENEKISTVNGITYYKYTLLYNGDGVDSQTAWNLIQASVDTFVEQQRSTLSGPSIEYNNMSYPIIALHDISVNTNSIILMLVVTDQKYCEVAGDKFYNKYSRIKNTNNRNDDTF